MKTTALILLLVALPSLAAAPCKEKRHASTQARKALQQCNKGWQDSTRTDSVEPTDDCVQKQANYVASRKQLRACLMSERAPKK